MTAGRASGRDNLAIYELHVGTFTPEGTFDGAIARLPTCTTLGVTAVELMPLAEFPGRRNWGYDGVDLYAPCSGTAGPKGSGGFVDAAHGARPGRAAGRGLQPLRAGRQLPARLRRRLLHGSPHARPGATPSTTTARSSEQVRHFVLQNVALLA